VACQDAGLARVDAVAPRGSGGTEDYLRVDVTQRLAPIESMTPPTYAHTQ